METPLRKISSAAFGLVLVCFFLPWMSFTCQGHEIATLSGVQLITGTSIQQPGRFGYTEERETDSEMLAVVALVLIVVGLVLSVFNKPKFEILPAISGLAALISLLMLKAKIDDQIISEGTGMLRVRYEAGYWMVLAGLVAAMLLNSNLFSLAQKRFRTTDQSQQS